EPSPAPLSLLAMPESVSPRRTTSECDSLPGAAGAEDAVLVDGSVDAAAVLAEAAASDAGAGACERAIAPPRCAVPVAAGATCSPAVCEEFGTYTGGSSSTVYSRIRWPRSQLASTSRVSTGSVMG